MYCLNTNTESKNNADHVKAAILPIFSFFASKFLTQLFDVLFVCFVALRPKSTAMVSAGRSVHLTTLFWGGKLEQAVNQYCVHILSLVTDNNPS